MTKANMKASAIAAEAMGKKSDAWNPDPGVYFVRVLEPVGAMEDKFFTGIPLHWGFGEPVPCPKRAWGGVCPICIRGNQLPDEEAKKYWPGWSAFVNILLVDEDGDPIPNAEGEAQVKTWRLSKETLGKVFDAIERESPSVDELIDITDSETGIDLRAKRTGKERETSWDISFVKRGASSIEEYREAWEPKMIDLTTYIPIKSAEELAVLMAGSTDAFTEAQQQSKPTLKRIARPKADAEEKHYADDAAVISADGTETPAPQSAGKAKLNAMLNKQKAATK